MSHRESVTVAGLAETIVVWTKRLFPDPERARRLIAELRIGFNSDFRPLTAESVAEVQTVARRHCRHLDLIFDASGALQVDRDPPGWPPVDALQVRRRGGFVRRLVRSDDGIGVLQLDSLTTAHLASPFLESAFRLLRHCSGIVLDLRHNGGGDPATVAIVLDWLLGPEPVHFADVIYQDRTRQWWTAGRPPGAAVPIDTPVAVLVGSETFSSAEGLAYFLRSAERATIVGTATRGAADHITPITLDPHVRGRLAEAYYLDPRTRSNWESVGVVPDLQCEEETALHEAENMLKRLAR